MADTKLSGLTALTGANLAAGDLFYVDDVSVTTSKSITQAELVIGFGITSGTQASTFTFNGSGGSTGSITMTYQKIGNFVTLHIPVLSATTGTGSTILSADTALPAAIRPASLTQVFSMNGILNNGAAASANGCLFVTTAGIVSLTRDVASVAFTNSAAAGTTQGTTLTYFVG